jgi:D-3-phosphoglycerate dehydrogenase
MSKKPYKVLLTGVIHQDGINILKAVAEVKQVSADISEDELMRELADCDAVVLNLPAKITKRVLENTPRLKVIGRHGIGLDIIDMKEAKRRGIPVVFAPLASVESVAEHTIGFMVALAKRIARADKELRKRGWKARYDNVGTELWGKTLGIIGLGKIGSEVAIKAKHAFNMKILAYDPYCTDEKAAELGVQLVDLDTLLRESNVVSIHAPLTKQTYNMIGKEQLAKMKKTAFLINTARGGIVNEAALFEALTKQVIAGAAVDVYGKEPVSPENPLLTLENIIVTPHTASLTHESIRRISVTVAEDVVRVLKGEKPRFLASV